MFTKSLKGIVLALAVGLVFLNGCGAGTKVSPTSSDEQMGTVQEGGQKAATYDAQQGDTLRKIAARADVYGDADLWPLLVQANEGTLGKSLKVTPGMTLNINRDATDEEKEAARNKARQSLAAAKAANKPIVPLEKSEIGNTQTASAAVTAMETPVPPQPVPKPKGGGFWLPILLILLFLLLLAAVILLYFMRKEQGE